MADLLLYGGGGHAKVVLDIILEAADHRVIGVLDDDVRKQGAHFQGIPFLGGIDVVADPRYHDAVLIVAIGDNRSREAVVGRLQRHRVHFAQAVHPTAHLARGVVVGDGTVIMAGVVINPDVTIGTHAIVNTASSIDHDCVIGDFAHVSPGVHLAGGVRIGRGVHVGIGAAVVPGIHIGDGAMVGAGAVVIDDVPDDATVVGVPARPVRRDDETRGRE